VDLNSQLEVAVRETVRRRAANRISEKSTVMTAEMTDRAVLMRQSTNPKELTDGKASRIGLSKESSAKRNMNKVDIDHKVLRV